MADQRESGAGYLTPYRDAVRDLGPSFGSLLWKNPEAQARRFDVLQQALKLLLLDLCLENDDHSYSSEGRLVGCKGDR